VSERSTALARTLARLAEIGRLDEAAMAAVRTHLEQLTKPPGSLGRLEELAVQLAGITGEPAPASRPRTIVVVAADHGVAAQGVSAYPSTVTAQMVANFLAGGAAINVLARQVEADVLVVDAGIASARSPDHGTATTGIRFVSKPIRAGTRDLSVGPAMTRPEALASIELGLEVAAAEARDGAHIIGLGEMGIGNTTAASAIAAVMTSRSAAEVAGRGSGVDDAGFGRKVAMIERALSINAPDPGDPIGVLATVGGFEIGALVGLILGSAAEHIPVVLDGFITGAAALLAAAIAPAVDDRLIASHRSVEPGHEIVLATLGLHPLLELNLRLGEGTGAALALGLVDAACGVRDQMATFASAGVAKRMS
jgi:nicotinate-nucleotide--dimethylbenzimidazole phosphoribosyltransferase